jgi:RNA polymerase sigma-70 factor, ECF subfamily
MHAVDDHAVDWQMDLNASGGCREGTLRRLHAFLLRAAYRELRRQLVTRPNLAGVELDDLAHQVADDALMAIIGKIDDFRGESRFTTWAYSFVVLEVSATLRRHFWCQPTVAAPMNAEECDTLADDHGVGPAEYAERRGLIAALQDALDTQLSRRQREVFVAVVVDGVPVDTLGARLGANRNAIHQTMFDARRKLRLALRADGYLPAIGPVGDAVR